MKFTLTSLILSMVAMKALAAPVSDPTGGLLPRQYYEDEEKEWIWKNSDDIYGDRIEVTIGKMRTAFGHLVPSSTLDKIDTDCSAASCQPGVTWNHPTVYVGNGGYDMGRYLVMNVKASFNIEGVGKKADMLNYAKIALQQVYREGAVTRKQGIKYIKDDNCPPSRTHGCRPDIGYVDQWIGISHLDIKIKSKEGATKAELNIGWELERDEGLDMCAVLTASGVGLGLAGAFPPVGALSTVIVLGGILCGSGA